MPCPRTRKASHWDISCDDGHMHNFNKIWPKHFEEMIKTNAKTKKPKTSKSRVLLLCLFSLCLSFVYFLEFAKLVWIHGHCFFESDVYEIPWKKYVLHLFYKEHCFGLFRWVSANITKHIAFFIKFREVVRRCLCLALDSRGKHIICARNFW